MLPCVTLRRVAHDPIVLASAFITKVCMHFSSRFAALCLLTASLLLPVAAVAQTATLHGQVTDPSGAVIPGAAISLTGGAVPIQTQSGADGEYAVHALAPGSYNISVTA